MSRPRPEVPSERPRPGRLLIHAGFVLLALAAVGALSVAVDWWVCLPEGALETATYVGRQACAECHQEQLDKWAGSDHDLAMDLATPETVLGDFEDCEFTHIAVDDVVKLSDRDLRRVIENVELSQWAVALHDLAPWAAGQGIAPSAKEKILDNFPEGDKPRLQETVERLESVRPCDVIDAHREIGDVMRRLKKEGEITVDFAVTSRMFRKGDAFFVTTDNRDGEMETFPVKYVFGYRPLQQYLVEFPNGRVQCLPITWDTEAEQWYHLYPKEPIPHDDMLHWTGPLQNWNYMCAECHTTNLQKDYRLADNTYHTTFSEIDVSCETCHGPGSLHVELSKQWSLFWDRRHGFGLPRLKGAESRVQIETCAPCHSRRRVIHPGSRPGAKLLDHYIPEVLDNNLYYADGQVLEEDYVYGSFIQSLMYDKGVRCTDCHDQFTTRVKFLDPEGSWNQVPDNRLCGQCHVAANYDTVSHHHHPDANKPGTKCVECHMPETKYMVVDPRRDHSLRVPRPDLTVALGIPNACNLSGCHDPTKGETAAWAIEQCETWYGEPEGPPHFAHAIAAGRQGKPEAERPLAEVVRRKDHRAAVRASAISLLAQYGSGEAQFRAFEGLSDPDELVRAVSVRSLENLPLDAGQVHGRLVLMLDDPVRAVRTEAARLLTRMPRYFFSKEDAEAFDAALAEYMENQEFLGDQPGAHLNMAVVYTNLGEIGKAERAYQTALRLDPRFVPAMINFAMLCHQQGRKDEAEQQFRKVIELEPELAEAYYSLGLLLAENEQRLEEASRFLAEAAKLAPQNPRIHYNYGLALQKLGRADEAEKALRAAHQLSPTSTDFLNALAILYTQQKDWERARAYAEQLIQLEPGNPQWGALLEFIQREAKEDKKVEADRTGSS